MLAAEPSRDPRRQAAQRHHLLGDHVEARPIAAGRDIARSKAWATSSACT